MLAACTPTGGGTAAVPSSRPTESSAPTAAPSVTSPSPTPDSAAIVLVRDVVEFELRGPYAWNGGSVTMRLHEGRIDEPIYFVRTDTSDESFAEQEGLVLVPVLALALEGAGRIGRLFLFENGADGRSPIRSADWSFGVRERDRPSRHSWFAAGGADMRPDVCAPAVLLCSERHAAEWA